MKLPRGWPYLAVAGGSGALLLALVLVLVLQWKSDAPAPAVTVAGVPGSSTFPPGFGRLDDLVPFAGGVAPVPEAVVAVAHAPEFRGADWVAAQSPESWTIQVMAARDEEAVKRFLADREDRVDFSYFVFPQDGSEWFVVTLGSFATRELAEGVAASKGLGTGEGRAFARRLGTYQEALRAAAEAAAAPAAPAPEAALAPDAAAPAPAATPAAPAHP